MPSTKSPVGVDDSFAELSLRANRHGVASAFRWLLKRGRVESVSAHELGALHQRLLERQRGNRRRSGAYYTPPSLVATLLDHALEPILAKKATKANHVLVERLDDLDRLPTNQRRQVAESLLTTSVLDPSCGAGVFLEAAAARLFAWMRPGTSRGASDAELRRRIADACLFGIDNDETAVMIARHAVGGDVRVGDSLLDPSPWPEKKFDVVVGNPPFANAIEGLDSAETKKRLAGRRPELRGTADLAFYFLAAAHEIATNDGAVGLVLPRSVLSAPAAVRLRERLLEERPPSFIFAPSDPLLFPGANVFVTLLVLKRNRACLGAVDSRGLHPVTISDENWWRALFPKSRSHEAGSTVGDVFEVLASMTAGEAYSLRPFIMEGTDDSPLRFVTTGLIDPGVCHWGTKTCRYLGERYARPSVSTEGIPDDLARRISRMARPKVLVAGLSTKVEAFLDAEGNHLGAVSTYSIMHPENDADALAKLCEHLNSEDAAVRLKRELGATALGGGRITLTKAFLRGFPFG